MLTAGVILLSCNSGAPVETPQVSVSVSVSTAHNKKIFIERIPYEGEKIAVLDSAVVNTARDSIVFHVPLEVDRQYRIRVSDSHTACSFIADAPYVRLIINNINGKCIVEGSPASSVLKVFVDKQRILNDSLHKITLQLDSFERNGGGKNRLAGLAANRDSLFKTINANNENFADTVSNAAAFIQAFSSIAFGDNRNALRAVVTKAAGRFPSSKAIARIKQDAVDMISIYEEEYNVGDTLPAITLPDDAGNAFNTASLHGKFYLIDFWATWYPKTLAFNAVKKRVSEIYPANKLTLVSVAMDDNINGWKNMILGQRLNWVQLIDENMWHGVAAKTLKFDSIPFNFLVNSEGRIIAKAIKPDSLEAALEKTIK